MSDAAHTLTPPRQEPEPGEQLHAPIRALAALLDLLGGTTLDAAQQRYLTLSREALASLITVLTPTTTTTTTTTTELAAHRAAVVALVAAKDVSATALVIGAIRVRHPLLAAQLEQRLGRREWAQLVADIDDASDEASDVDDEQTWSPITPDVVARFEATVRSEQARLAAAIDSTTTASLLALVRTMSHRFAGSAASFGYAALGDRARAISGALRTNDGAQVVPLARQLLAAMGAVDRSRR